MINTIPVVAFFVAVSVQCERDELLSIYCFASPRGGKGPEMTLPENAPV